MWYNVVMKAYAQAKTLADIVLRGKVDKAGFPLFDHALRVRRLLPADIADEQPEATVAILHDICEDSQVTIQDLREFGFSPAVLVAVDALTRREQETYTDYIHRLAPNRTARMVKLADLHDHIGRAVMPGRFVMTDSMAKRYLQALDLLSHYE